jgi:hypothetical protein
MQIKKTNDGTARGDALRFPSFIYHSIDDFEVVKNLNGFLSNPLPSKVVIILWNFQHIPKYPLQNQNT